MFKKMQNSTFSRVMSLLENKLVLYLLSALTASIILGYGFNMVLAYISRNVLDASMNNDQDLLVRALILAAVTFFLGTPIWIGAKYLIALITKRTMKRIRVQLFGHIVNLPTGAFGEQHSGDLVSRSTNDLSIIETVFKNLIPGLFLGFVLGVIGMILIFVMDWRLGVISLVTGLLVMALTLKMAGPIRTTSESVQAALGKQTERLTNLLQGLQVSKMFHLEEITHEQYRIANDEWVNATIKQGSLQALFMSLNDLMDAVKSIGTLVFGLYLLTLGQGTLGTIVAAIHLQGNAGFLFSNLGMFTTYIQRSLAGGKRVFEVLDKPTEETHQSQRQAEVSLPVTTEAAVEVQSMSFSYESDEEAENILHEVNMTILPGQVSALVGPSGGGKSTLIKLLMGLYAPTEGSIFLRGKSTLNYPLNDLREMIAYVPQDAYLFDGTIEENIQFGNPDASEDEIMDAAKAAYAHDFIMEQSEGYQTHIGEHGAHLSGGQRQRIAIARALLKNAPILLLDEATSALDSESEQLVQKALNTLMEGRTTLAVAHRLSTIQRADTIYVIDDGRIAEQGTHRELLEQGGLYQKLHSIQFNTNQ